MSAATHHSSGNLWHKFRSSTKSLSSSLSNLSVKNESDGDSPTSTVVHKALVRFYKNQEPFTGFPGWLGHKEELPDEQKILKKQNHISSNPISSSLSHMRKSSSDNKKHHNKSTPPFADQQHSSAGMAFHKIYNSQPSTEASTAFSLQPESAQDGQRRSVGERGSLQTPSPPPGANTSTMMMRERLKRQNTKTSFRLGSN